MVRSVELRCHLGLGQMLGQAREKRNLPMAQQLKQSTYKAREMTLIGQEDTSQEDMESIHVSMLKLHLYLKRRYMLLRRFFFFQALDGPILKVASLGGVLILMVVVIAVFLSSKRTKMSDFDSSRWRSSLVLEEGEEMLDVDVVAVRSQDRSFPNRSFKTGNTS